MMSPRVSIDRPLIEAKIASWMRKNTSKRQQWFFPIRSLFDGIKMDYDNKNDYRIVMDIINQWRRQAPFFYQTMVQEGELTGKTIYNDFEQFLKDWNATGAYFLWHRNVRTEDGKVISGFYQPTNAEDKIQIENKRNDRCIKQLKNRFIDMIKMATPLPSGYTPELALDSIERFEKKYLLPEHEEENQV